jgi:hypothetical protein
VVPVGAAFTVYLVIGVPPESTGAFQLTEIPPLSGVNLIPTAAPGADLGVVEIAFEAAEVPASLTAVTVTD